ncbi:MAG: DNA topoisomerase IB [Lysobacter sp.]|nr:DNA topoisomerase IB [Lysobacter sp.]
MLATMHAAAGPLEDKAHAAAGAGLRHVSDREPGIRRIRHGRGFVYRDADGRTLRDKATLERIRALAVPPAWTDVWICADARGHVQATGRDARDRKQYRYHVQWSAARGNGKFDHVVGFGEALPALRRCLRQDWKREGFPRDKVLAIVVGVMAETLVRVGNPEYARSNRSYGLTTLRNRHVAFLAGGRARFRFRGKGGQEHEVVLDDARLVQLVRRCQQLPGQALFQYEDDEGNVVPVDSGEVNAYLRESMRAEYTAKDFRTWGATLAAFQRLANTEVPVTADGSPASERAHVSLQNAIIGEVAQALGNTPAVCRKSYIDPIVFAGWRDGRLQAAAAKARGERQWELATLRFLRAAHRDRARKTTTTGGANKRAGHRRRRSR